MRHLFCRDHCGYFQKETGGPNSYGCSRFTVAEHCPVGMIEGAVISQYEISFEEGVPPAALVCAQACCPAPGVRLQSLTSWPVQPVDTLRGRAELSDRAEPKAMIDRLDAALNLPIQIGAVED
jgi:hypothetical protein